MYKVYLGANKLGWGHRHAPNPPGLLLREFASLADALAFEAEVRIRLGEEPSTDLAGPDGFIPPPVSLDRDGLSLFKSPEND